jgi:hypothetical protein
MEGQVQQFVTLRIGSLWFDVPIGPLMTLLSQSLLRSVDRSPTKQVQEKESLSSSMEGFTYVLSKSTKDNMIPAEKASAHGVVSPIPMSYMEGQVVEVGLSSYQEYKNKVEVDAYKNSKMQPLVPNGKENRVYKHHDK